MGKPNKPRINQAFKNDADYMNALVKRVRSHCHGVAREDLYYLMWWAVQGLKASKDQSSSFGQGLKASENSGSLGKK